MENISKIIKDAIMPKKYRNPLYVGAIRNRPCVCGSGKKIKHCHGEKYDISEAQAKEINQLIADHHNNKQANKIQG